MVKTIMKKPYHYLKKLMPLSKKSELLFYQGNAQLAKGKTIEAIDTFKQHILTSDSLTKRTHWYLALAYLKNKETAQSKRSIYY